MKKLLITGFDPFGGESINPSWEAVKKLKAQIGNYELIKAEIHTVFGTCFEDAMSACGDCAPDAVICVGQAGGRPGLAIEVVGINLREARIADNAGNQPKNKPVIEGAPAAYFSTLPVRDMVKAAEEAGYNAALSFSAGAFVCNDLLYSMLNHFDGSNTKVAFIHVPFLPEQAKGNAPSMELSDITAALTAIIASLD